MLDRKSMKRGDSTIEIALSIVMAVIVLYLILNLFSGNISTIVKNSGLYKATHKDNSAKTSWDPEPTKTQVNVEIVADQGTLAQYHNDAAGVIEGYEAESHTETLSDQNIMKLALQMTIFVESDTSGTSPLVLLANTYFAQNPSMSYYKFMGQNGITISAVDRVGAFTETRRNGEVKLVYWGTKLKSNGKKYNEYAQFNNTSSDANSRVKNIEQIKNCFNEQYKINYN